MVGFAIKLASCPLLLVISDALFRNVSYDSPFQAAIVGLFLAIVSHLMELIVLRRGTLWISTAVDFVAAFIVVYYSQFFFSNAVITILGAIYTSVLLAVVEYGLHLYLIRSGKAEKEA